MAIGVSLWFDPELEEKVRKIWRELADAGIHSSLYDGRYRPHITLGVWEQVDARMLEEAVRGGVRTRSPLEIEFQSVGLLPTGEGVAVLQPLMTDAILALQRDVFHIGSRLGSRFLPYFGPGRWIPHCTMAWEVRQEKILAAAGLLLERSLPLNGLASAIGIIDTPAEIELARIELRAEQPV